MKSSRLRHSHVYAAIDSRFPFSNALPDDPSGWAIVDQRRDLRKIAVALEANARTIEAAAEACADVLVVHHPPIMRPLQRVEAGEPSSDAVLAACRLGVDILAAHTNVDASPGGLNDRLCSLLHLKPLAPMQGAAVVDEYKLVTFVPSRHADKVAAAAFGQGAGIIGDYARCSFRADGVGTFLPLDRAAPFSGEKGVESREPETRLEMVVPKKRLARVLVALTMAHPYEEPVCDVYPLQPVEARAGLGRWAELDRAEPFGSFTGRVRSALGIELLTRVGRPPRRVKTVAVCTGSGRSLVGELAARPGAVFLTGELGYHDQRNIEAMGACALMAGHFGTERIFIDLIIETLGEELAVPAAPIRIEREPAVPV